MGAEEAMIELNKEQRQELDQPGPVQVRDPQTGRIYVLVPADVYERIGMLLEDDASWAEDSFRAALEVFARDGWDDPRMDVYDALDPRRQP
jgi:hypothetical protein